MSVITENCQILGVLRKAPEPLTPTDIGESIGMNATHAGQRLYALLQRGRVEKPDKKRGAYLITQEGQKYLDNPPPEPPEKMTKSGAISGDESGDISGGVKIGEKVDEKLTVTPTVTPPKESVIPSQADIFRSIAEQLGITKAMDTAKGGTPLKAIINYVQRTGLLNKVPFRAVDQHKRWHPCFCHVSRG